MAAVGAPALPRAIYSGAWSAGHVQGIALDTERGCLYLSFTTLLVKLGLDGALLGTVTGLAGHLGCLARGPHDGRIYGSLEYKTDAIGTGIRQRLGPGNASSPRDGFYVAVFDGDKITRPGMDAGRDGVMTAVYLPEVLRDYAPAAQGPSGEGRRHRYGCSGIDGLSFGPMFGEPGGPWGLCVAYGVYGDVTRRDNDHQVLLWYDTAGWAAFEAPLDENAMHRQGPKHPNGKYFVHTGNTTYGVQNLEYDPHTGHWLMAVYPGKKPEYPNGDLYIVHGGVAPRHGPLRGVPGEQGALLQLWQAGLRHPQSGVYYWRAGCGATGLCALGGGLFYVAHPGAGAYGRQYAGVRLHRWTGTPPCPFEEA